MSTKYIETRSKRRWHFEEPRVEDVHVEDIAYALAHINRFNGHVGVYSVATHSCLVADIVLDMGHKELEFEALMHDAHEAYVCDVPTPLKNLLPRYQELEKKTEQVVRNGFHLPINLSSAVKRADMIALATEATFFHGDIAHWKLPEQPSDRVVLAGEDPLVSYRRWLDRTRKAGMQMTSGGYTVGIRTPGLDTRPPCFHGNSNGDCVICDAPSLHSKYKGGK